MRAGIAVAWVMVSVLQLSVAGCGAVDAADDGSGSENNGNTQFLTLTDDDDASGGGTENGGDTAGSGADEAVATGGSATDVASPGADESDGTTDLCPDDPDKLSPGACGCGQVDLDSDADGTADCIDECPQDSQKFDAGICGCGVDDNDADADGVPDCVDACPFNPAVVNASDLVPGSARISFAVTFNDPGGKYAVYHDGIEENILAAGAAWAELLAAATDVTLEIEVAFADVPTANGGSMTSVFLRNNGTYDIYEQGAAAEIRTGVDPNGTTPDARITFGYNHVSQELWFDPDPTARTQPVPADRTDGYSVCLHELGHILAFNGWRSVSTGEVPSIYASAYDEVCFMEGGIPYFAGDEAVDVYGGPVPQTYLNLTHLGNADPRPGRDLVDEELMNGVWFYRGTRYYISDLDVAILRDVGLPLVADAPGVDPCDAKLVRAKRVAQPDIRVGPPPVLRNRCSAHDGGARCSDH